MKKNVLKIMASTGITLVVLSIVALCYGATVIFISAVFQSLLLNILIHTAIYILNQFEYRYPIVETGVKLAYILALVLIGGRIFGWYASLSAFVLGIMTLLIYGLCVFVDAINLLNEVKSINVLLEKEDGA